ncbi:MAG: glycosyltransferase family 4 protein [Actinomycetota bacterium]
MEPHRLLAEPLMPDLAGASDAPDGRLLAPGAAQRPRSLMVVSHACVVPQNQAVFAEVADRGWHVQLIVPARWRHEYSPGTFPARVLPRLKDECWPIPVLLAGSPQRHVYRCRTARRLRAARPDVVFIEAEHYSVPALQWAMAAHRLGIPFGVQAAENLDRPLPRPARAIRSWVLGRAAFVAARSPTAADLARRWGAIGQVSLIPHAVPPGPVAAPGDAHPLGIGFAGRLVGQKGLWDLVEAVRLLPGPVRLLLAGDGPLRDELAGLQLPNAEVAVLTGLDHGAMAQAYAQMDVLALPSRSTPTWVEQFGRTLVEALWCGVPVVGSDSGEIPWVIGATGGGVPFPEGNHRALAEQLTKLRSDDHLRASLARTGRQNVQCLFSTAAAADALMAAVEAVAAPSARRTP